MAGGRGAPVGQAVGQGHDGGLHQAARGKGQRLGHALLSQAAVVRRGAVVRQQAAHKGSLLQPAVAATIVGVGALRAGRGRAGRRRG